jgi:hypothetical protein
VENKVDLLKQSFDMAANRMKVLLGEALGAEKGNAIDKLFALEHFAEHMLRGEEDRLMNQLGTYYPEVAGEVNKAREELVMNFTRANLKEGIAQGLYRDDLNIEYISILYYGHILAVHESVVTRETLDFNGLRKASLRYHIRGIASSKGLDYLNKRLTQ